MSSRGHADRSAAPDRASDDPVDALLQRLREQVAAADPPGLRRWWTALSEVERQALIIDSPTLVGSAAGVPARHRDEANRLRMLSDLDLWGDLGGDLSDADQDGVTTAPARSLLAAIRETQRHAEAAPPDPPLLVLLYRADPATGRAEVALCLGDPDATEAVVAVPDPERWDLAALTAARDGAAAPTAVVGWRGSAVALHALLDGLRAAHPTPSR